MNTEITAPLAQLKLRNNVRLVFAPKENTVYVPESEASSGPYPRSYSLLYPDASGRFCWIEDGHAHHVDVAHADWYFVEEECRQRPDPWILSRVLYVHLAKAPPAELVEYIKTNYGERAVNDQT